MSSPKQQRVDCHSITALFPRLYICVDLKVFLIIIRGISNFLVDIVGYQGRQPAIIQVDRNMQFHLTSCS